MSRLNLLIVARCSENSFYELVYCSQYRFLDQQALKGAGEAASRTVRTHRNRGSVSRPECCSTRALAHMTTTLVPLHRISPRRPSRQVETHVIHSLDLRGTAAIHSISISVPNGSDAAPIHDRAGAGLGMRRIYAELIA